MAKQSTKTADKATAEIKLITIDDFNVNALAEIAGKREEQETLVKENPFVKIEDNATWEIAKKSRTKFVSGRTGMTKEKKDVLSKIKSLITEPVSKIYDELIEITLPHEVAQQTEIKAYEDIKENERLAREKIEEERKEKHRNVIIEFVGLANSQIDNLNFETSQTFEIVQDPEMNLEEFQDLFDGKLEVLTAKLIEKKRELTEKEDFRVKQEKFRIQQERIGLLISAGFSYDGNNYFVDDLRTTNLDFITNTSEERFNELLKAGVAEIQRIREIEQSALKAKQDAELLASQEADRIAKEKQSIERNKAFWTKRINELTFASIKQVVKEFQESPMPKYDKDLQKEFNGNMTEIEKSLEAKIEFLQDKEELRVQKELLEVQKKENLIAARKNELYAIGFDKDLSINIGVDNTFVGITSDDLELSEDEWQEFISKTEEKLETLKNPPAPVEEIEVVVEEVVQPNEVDEEEVENDKNYEIPRAELEAVIYNFSKEASYDNLLSACQNLGLLNEKE